jgi:hypothetical protein
MLQPAGIIAELRVAFDEHEGEMEASDAHAFFVKMSSISAVAFLPPSLEFVEDASSWGTIYMVDGEDLLLALLSSSAELPLPSKPSETSVTAPPSLAAASQGSSSSDDTSMIQTSLDYDARSMPIGPYYATGDSADFQLAFSRALRILDDALDNAGGQLEPVELIGVFQRVVAAGGSGGQNYRWNEPTIEQVEELASWGVVHALDCHDLLRAALLG